MAVSRKRKPAKPERRTRPKWEGFERLVASIHLAEAKGAAVTWNKHIDGRQFDVIIKFKAGFYDYLTLIECKDYKKAVPVEKVEAFVTKAKHHQANKAIMVSPYGFQSGGKTVAKKENIELYSLKQIEELPEATLIEILHSYVVIQLVGFRYKMEPAFIFSQSPEKLKHELDSIELSGYPKLEKLLFPITQLVSPVPLFGVPDFGGFKRATAFPQHGGFQLMMNTILSVDGKEIPVSEILFYYWAETIKLVDVKGIDPTIYSLLAGKLEYKDELTGKVFNIDGINLPLGIDTKFEESNYYYNPHFNGFSYFCEKIDFDNVILILLESIQHGQLYRGEFRELASTSTSYIKIKEESELLRLEMLLEEFITLRNTTPPTIISSNARGWVTDF